MQNKFLQKWLPIATIAFAGMFLSEILIWNVFNFNNVFVNQKPQAAVVFIISGLLVYFSVFVVFIDVIQRFKIKDTVGVLLLGSIYGLFLESLSSTVYQAGFGPKILELWFVRIAFTGLSWHPIIDFFLLFILIKLIFKRKINLQNDKLTLREGVVAGVFVFFWVVWTYAKWLLVKLPAGVPLGVQLIGLLYPIVVFGILLYLVFKYSKNYVPNKILNWKSYLLFFAILFFYSYQMFSRLPNKFSFFSIYIVIVFYLWLLVLHLNCTRTNKKTSFYEDLFPILSEFSILKYFKLSILVVSLFILMQVVIAILKIQFLMTIVSGVFYLLFLAFSLLFPMFVVCKIVFCLISKPSHGD